MLHRYQSYYINLKLPRLACRSLIKTSDSRWLSYGGGLIILWKFRLKISLKVRNMFNFYHTYPIPRNDLTTQQSKVWLSHWTAHTHFTDYLKGIYN